MLKRKRKFVILIILTIIVIGAYFTYRNVFKDKNIIRYVTAAVEKGTLVITVAGSGQVSASNQVDIKPKVSGDIASIGVKQGQIVKTGAILVKLDTADAQKTVRDAETSLETTRLELEELMSPPDELTIFQAESALTQAEDSLTKLEFSQEISYQKALQAKQKAIDNITKSYEDSFNTIETVFFNVPAIMTDLREILYEDTINENQTNIGAYKGYDGAQMLTFITSAENDYSAALVKYTANLENYKNTSRYASQSVIESLLTETLETSKAVAQTVKSEKNIIDLVIDYISQKKFRTPNIILTYQSDLETYLSQTNSFYSSLLTIQQTIQNNKDALVNAEQDITQMDQDQPLDLAAAERSVEEKKKKLADLKAGPDDLDVRAKKITVQQKEDVLLDAKENLTNHFIRAPFDGVVANVNVKKGDSVSSGTILLSLITQQKIAEISFNEIDIVKVKLDQKVILTFDAVEDLTISGRVIEVDSIGTVSQGVVTYNVKINFDADDERIKPEMSVNSDIITDARQDVLLVPNVTVKTQGSVYYVQTLDIENLPHDQEVVVGLANDISTEIISGLEEGDKVITQTISSSSKASSNNTNSSVPGNNSMQMMRMMR